MIDLLFYEHRWDETAGLRCGWRPVHAGLRFLFKLRFDSFVNEKFSVRARLCEEKYNFGISGGRRQVEKASSYA